MNLSDASISLLALVIFGKNTIAQIGPNRTMHQLQTLFEPLVSTKAVMASLPSVPSRRDFTIAAVKACVEAGKLPNLIQTALDPRHYLGTGYKTEPIAEQLNDYFRYDGLEVARSGNFYKLRKIGNSTITSRLLSADGDIDPEFVKEHLEKCVSKLAAEDFSGAITNARSLVEIVLQDLEARFDSAPTEYDGSLPKLYGRVQRLMNLSPSRTDIDTNLRQMLTGLCSIINGLAGVRGKLSDSHGVRYKAELHHARLAVNAATTITDFLMDSYSYQARRGLLRIAKQQQSDSRLP